MFTSSLNNMVKSTDDMDEQPDEELHRARYKRVPSVGASVSVELGHITLLDGCVPQPGSSLNPILLGFYGSFLM